MRFSHFDQAVEQIYTKNPKIEKEAYSVLRDALDYTAEKAKHKDAANRHVSAAELLRGFRDYCLNEYGPMAATLFQEWNLRSCSDIGDMVFALIDEGIFSKQDSDRLEDFSKVYDFKETFVTPFLPMAKKGAKL